jgi:hypothetical protein
MPRQMYLVRAKENAPGDANEQIAEFVARRGGYLLMATASGSLIITVDDGHFDALKAHAWVEFAGPISFNPEGKATAALQRVFATNVARQMLAGGSGPIRPIRGAGSEDVQLPPV